MFAPAPRNSGETKATVEWKQVKTLRVPSTGLTGSPFWSLMTGDLSTHSRDRTMNPCGLAPNFTNKQLVAFLASALYPPPALPPRF